MKYKNLIFVTIIIAAFVGVYIYVGSVKKKIVYVKVGDLYAEFEMKKELENTYLTVQKGRKQQLDSLELELKLLRKKIESEGVKQSWVNVFDEKKEMYLLKKQQFEEDDAQMQSQYSAKIMKQLNQYVTDYGKENNCDYIFGAEGSGALMYAREMDDVTKRVAVYINNKFKGVK